MVQTNVTLPQRVSVYSHELTMASMNGKTRPSLHHDAGTKDRTGDIRLGQIQIRKLHPRTETNRLTNLTQM